MTHHAGFQRARGESLVDQLWIDWQLDAKRASFGHIQLGNHTPDQHAGVEDLSQRAVLLGRKIQDIAKYPEIWENGWYKKRLMKNVKTKHTKIFLYKVRSTMKPSLCRPTSVSAESSCSLSSLVYESQMFLMVRKPCMPQGRLTVTSKSVMSFTQPSIRTPSFTFWEMQKTHSIQVGTNLVHFTNYPLVLDRCVTLICRISTHLAAAFSVRPSSLSAFGFLIFLPSSLTAPFLFLVSAGSFDCERRANYC